MLFALRIVGRQATTKPTLKLVKKDDPASQ
jgi:hypothetical protein